MFYCLRVWSDGNAVAITSIFLLIVLLVSKLVISGSGIFNLRSIAATRCNGSFFSRPIRVFFYICRTFPQITASAMLRFVVCEVSSVWFFIFGVILDSNALLIRSRLILLTLLYLHYLPIFF